MGAFGKSGWVCECTAFGRGGELHRRVGGYRGALPAEGGAGGAEAVVAAGEARRGAQGAGRGRGRQATQRRDLRLVVPNLGAQIVLRGGISLFSFGFSFCVSFGIVNLAGIR